MTEAQQPAKESPLKRRREELGLSNWETGRFKEVKVTLPQVKALCRVLKWSIDDLPDDFRPLD
jgi:putative transcriptional regulator